MPRIRASSIGEHKALTRRSLLDAARDLIEERGTAEISLGDIAFAAGVGRTTFYDYFADRDDVIAALVEEELPRVVADLIAVVPDGLSTAERLATLAAETVEFVAKDRVFGVILHREVGRMSPDAQERIVASHVQLSTELADLYRRGVEEGVFRSLPPRLAGSLIQDTIMSAAKVFIEGEDSPERLEEITSGLREFLLGGLGSPGVAGD
ncbi:MAG TPA: TetR/AcrR family transcriptional regulator [Acidimicrobiia bacterium]|nr:TetR/AcrR family transcriptional regulator [Acidimicrobiia bacterium]